MRRLLPEPQPSRDTQLATQRAKAHPVRRGVKRVLLAMLMICLVASLLGGLTLYARHRQRQLGVGAVEEPTPPATVVWGDDLARTGRFTADVAFTDFAAPTGEATVPVTWDDAWFFADASAYNPELASAAAVIAALAYAESGYYQAATDCLPYIEIGLGALGFTDISTASYRYRSEVTDEVLSLVTDESDAAAYGIAEKLVTSADGEERQLIAVTVRGSYGSEWLSNLQVLGGEDHPGYVAAADEICGELAPRIARAHAEGRAVELLLVGHSRGGAIANLVASRADDSFGDGVTMSQVGDGDAGASATAQLGLTSADGVRAYTFASPATTTAPDAAAARYGNIFNIVNPADIMTYLPLQSWGYARYGVDVALPSVAEADFSASHAKMESTFLQIMDAESPYRPEDEQLIGSLLTDIGTQVDSAEALLTPAGVATVVSTCALRVNPMELLYAHYPSVYIAWLYAEASAEVA